MNSQNLKLTVSKIVHKRFHILQWLPKYTKFDGISDLVAGITVGLTMMPQSMAYASLANLPPHYGLYSSFMGALIYIFFGTIKEVSIGPTSLMALLTLSYTKDLPVDFIILLCFLCGWIELLMGIFKLGFMVDFISAPAVSGFTSATSVIIILAQLKGLFGIKFNSDNIFHYIQKFIAKSSSFNKYDLLIGICCIAFLITFKSFVDIKFKNRILKKIFWFLSISRNALIVLICSLVAFYFEYHNGSAPFTLSGKVIGGVPNFQLPNFSTKIGNETVTFIEMIQTLGSGILVLPAVAVLANVAIAKAFVTDKPIDATQEMITLGLCNIFGSFVQSMPTCGAFTRSAIAHTSGIRTPMAGIYAASIILLALTFLTPYFYYVPIACLSAILISAVMFMIDFKIVPKLWKSNNKYDLLITIATFVISLMYGVEQGLLVGVLLNFVPLLKFWTRPKVDFVLKSTKKEKQYLIIKPELGLYYSAVNYLTQQIIKTSLNMGSSIPIIVDCVNFLNVDYTAIQAFGNIIKDFKERKRQIYFLNMSDTVFSSLNEIMNINGISCYKTEDELCNSLGLIRNNIDDDVEMALLSHKESI